MPTPDQTAIGDALAAILDPHTEKTLGASEAVTSIEASADLVKIQLTLSYPAEGWRAELVEEAKKALAPVAGSAAIQVEIGWQVQAQVVQQGLTRFDNIKNIIAVASGKGGVGKSTTAVNLALALAAEGATVGLLDADIYGPSTPQMLGVKGHPESLDGKSLEPLMAQGIQIMSIGFLVGDDQPMVWRGPMATGALQQLLTQTLWKNVDYLVVDLPPGTGDIQLTLAQRVPVSGSVIVTTPQDLALLDVRKAIKMFQQVRVPMLGVVENMSGYVCPNCGSEAELFGSGGGAKLEQEYNMPLLAQIPLDLSIREQTDGGRPPVLAAAGGEIASRYRLLARKVAGRLSLHGRDYSALFPKIVIEKA